MRGGTGGWFEPQGGYLRGRRPDGEGEGMRRPMRIGVALVSAAVLVTGGAPYLMLRKADTSGAQRADRIAAIHEITLRRVV